MGHWVNAIIDLPRILAKCFYLSQILNQMYCFVDLGSKISIIVEKPTQNYGAPKRPKGTW